MCYMFQLFYKAVIMHKHKNMKLSTLCTKPLLVKKNCDLLLFMVQTMMCHINTVVPPRG